MPQFPPANELERLVLCAIAHRADEITIPILAPITVSTGEEASFFDEMSFHYERIRPVLSDSQCFLFSENAEFQRHLDEVWNRTAPPAKARRKLDKKPNHSTTKSILRDLASATAALWNTDENGFIVNPCYYCKMPWRDCRCKDGFPVKNELRVKDDFAWKDENGQPHILLGEEISFFMPTEVTEKSHLTFWINDKRAEMFSFPLNFKHGAYIKKHCCKGREEVYEEWVKWEDIHWTPGLRKAIEAGMKLEILPPWTPTDEHTTS